MNTVKILGEAVGIQRQGLIDRTETQTSENLTEALIVGQFRRGRTDKPMTINLNNIRGELGYDPNNPDYIAVQDCLDTGIPSVQVLRINTESSGNNNGNNGSENGGANTFGISCAGATNNAKIFNPYQGNQLWEIEIVKDGVSKIYENISGTNLSQIFVTSALYEANQFLSVVGDSSQTCYFVNQSMSPVRIRLEPKNSDAQQAAISSMNDNPTLVKNDGAFYFCLGVLIRD